MNLKPNVILLIMRPFLSDIRENISSEKILPGELIYWFSICFIRVGTIVDNFSDPFWPNMSGCAMTWMNSEVLFSQSTSSSIGSTIESVPSDLSFWSEIAFQQGLIMVFGKTKCRSYVNYWFPIRCTMNSVHNHVMLSRKSLF